MKVSIIVPVYNVEDYVKECLNSVKDLNINYEIIVVNDGSKDNSLEIVNKFAESYNGEIKIISKENGGLSSARNVGIEKATGDYLFFLDSDDYIDKYLFESFVRDVNKDSVDIGFADYCYLRNGIIVSNTEAVYRKKIARKRNDIVDGVTYGDRFFDEAHDFINVEACFLLIKKSLLSENQIEFKQGIYHEDTLFTITCLTVARKVKFYDYPFYVYRMRDDSIMHTPNPNVIEKKFKDKGVISLELLKQKKKLHINAKFLDTLIVDLYLVSVMHFRKKSSDALLVINRCINLTLKARIRVILFKILSRRYV